VAVVAFSPDGKTAATGSEDHRVLLWDLASGAVKFKLQHQHRVKTLRFSPDGRLVAIASKDRTARLWDATTGKQVGAPWTHPGEAARLAFTPDGRQFAVGCWTPVANAPGSAGASSSQPARPAEGGVFLWPVPQPQEGDQADLRLWQGVHTGLELDASGAIHTQPAQPWRERYQELLKKRMKDE
jgi:WD40 repeat protein